MATRKGKLLNVYLPEELAQRLEDSAKRNYRTKTVQVILALERFLADDEKQDGTEKKPAPKKGKGE